MGFLSGLFGGGGKNPADAAMPYLNQIAPMANQNLGPWANQGQQAQQSNQSQYNAMATDPAGFLAQLRASYTPSEGYKFKQGQMTKAAEGAAAAGGFRGTEADKTAQQKLVQGLLGEDEGAYLDRLLGITNTGLTGNEAIANRGYGASGDLTNVLGSTLGAQGGLAYKGQESENEQANAFRKMLFQLAGGALGSFGGPAGAVAGSQLGGSLAGGSTSKNGPAPSNAQQFGAALYGMGK